MILFALSLIAGVLTVLAPCTLPLLPVIVGSSVEGGRNLKKAFVISLSLGISVITFTILLKVSSSLIYIPQNTWNIISGLILIIFGLVSLYPGIWENLSFVSKLSIDSNKVLGFGYSKKNLLGDVIVGASLGPVFSSCSPTYFVVLATVLPNSYSAGLADLVAYSFGLSVSLFILSILGQRLIVRLGWVSDTHGTFRRILGLLFIILGFFILIGIDKDIERKILDSGFFDITKVEQILLANNVASNTVDSKVSQADKDKETSSNPGSGKEKQHGPLAKEIVNPSGYINTDGKPITIQEFRGKKVVLLDIWTYSCINCQRTLPYIKAWYEKYKDKGLVVIGLHTPEFSFEKVKTNVEDAVKRFGITYPVVMDNDYSTWTAYGNQYWPRKYLISADGEIVYDHIGEGGYDETEKEIQKALNELNDKFTVVGVTKPTDEIQYDPTKVRSPETYFGSNRNEYLGNGKKGFSGIQNLEIPKIIYANTLYLSGSWNFYPEYSTTIGPGKIIYKYNSKNVYIVASSEKGIELTIINDGKKEKNLLIKENRLYNVVEADSYGEHTLEIDIPESGLNVFTFTFG
jgi:cytochrome c biogenesis protein CcdA/thiol-disulfide isomerase/thioredoxin